jgi:tetratricopeptide (TPR) repeat protein
MVRPTITVQAVREALDGLLYTSRQSNANNALQVLTLVDEFITHPALPSFENVRTFALNTILTDAISQEFSLIRQSINRPVPSRTSTRLEETRLIQEDGKTRSIPLISWGYLYYRYVRVDLNLLPEEFATYVQVDVRTMRRYQSQAIDALTEKLVLAEWKARIRLRKRRLYNALPIIPTVNLFGRENELSQINEAFNKGQRQIFVTGAQGTGKTVFVQEFVRRLIESPEEPFVENVIWLTAPTSKDSVIRPVYERVCPADSPLTLRDCLSQYRTVIVMDNISKLSQEVVDELLSYLSNADVIVINRTFIPLRANAIHVILNNLNYAHTVEYIRWLNIQEVAPLEDIDMIYQEAAGNPLAIKLMVNALKVDPTHTLLYTANPFYQELDNLPDILIKAWTACMLLPPSGLPREKIIQLWNIGNREIAQLLAYHVLIADVEHRITIASPAFDAINIGYKQFPQIQQWVAEKTNALLETIALKDAEEILIVEHLLSLDLLSTDQAVKWLGMLLPKQQHRRSTHWLDILEKWVTREGFETYRLEYGRTLRQFQQWEKSQLELERVIIEAGGKGDFSLQAEAMLELAVLFNTQGMQSKTARLLEEALRLARLYKNVGLNHRIHIEMAQLAIDQDDSNQALTLLEHIPPNGRATALRAEALLLVGRYNEGIELAKQALKFYVGDRLNSSITYILLGRLYTVSERYSKAHQAFLSAVIMLEGLNHLFALARARTNLAIVYIHQGEHQQARELLTTVEKTQMEIRDMVGLEFTRHNLRHIDDLL